MPLATVAATSSEMNAPTKFRTAASATATRGDIARVEIGGRDRVGGVVEAVGEVERQRRGDDDDEDDVAVHWRAEPLRLRSS